MATEEKTQEITPEKECRDFYDNNHNREPTELEIKAHLLVCEMGEVIEEKDRQEFFGAIHRSSGRKWKYGYPRNKVKEKSEEVPKVPKLPKGLENSSNENWL